MFMQLYFLQSEEEALAASVLEVNGEPSNHSDGVSSLEQDKDVLLAWRVSASVEESQSIK